MSDQNERKDHDLHENEAVNEQETIEAQAESVHETEDMNEVEEVEETAVSPAAHAMKSGGARWPWIALSVIAIGALAFTLLSPGKSNASKAVAMVNGSKISQQDLYDAMVKQGGPQTLDTLIQEKLVSLELAKKNIKVTDQDVAAEIADIKKQFKSEAEFQSILQQNNMTEADLTREMTKQVGIKKYFEPDIKITDDEMKKYFEDNKANYSTPEQVKASHILVKTQEEADAVLKQLKDGADFAAVAKQKSTDPGSKDQGGDLGYFGRDSGFDKTFEDAAFKLNVGETSGAVKTQFGFHIIKVTDKKAAATPTFEEKKADVQKALLQQKIGEKYNAWLDKLKTDAHIENYLDTKTNNAAAPTAAAPDATGAAANPAATPSK